MRVAPSIVRRGMPLATIADLPAPTRVRAEVAPRPGSGGRRLGACSSIRQLCRNSRAEPFRTAARRAGAVQRIARERMAERGEVDADLMRPAGDQVQLEQVQPGSRSRTR